MSFAQPNWPKALPAAVVLGFATLGPVGRYLPAPGTWGSVAGLAYFAAGGFRSWDPIWALGASAIGGYLAVALCGEAEVRLGKTDPGEVILDELVAMPVCFLGWPVLVSVMPTWAVMLGGFLLFRLFDIFKPFGISRLQRLPGGWGVVVDDLAAALATCGTLHLATWLWSLR